jgi:HAD superfamily hydrolase (TIGR01509 family)
MLQAIIFDLDGVLINSEKIYPIGCRAYWRKFGLEIPSRADLKGVGMRRYAQVIIEENRLPVSVDEAVKELNEICHSLIFEKGKASPGLGSALSNFKKAGLKLAVASSAEEHYVLKALEKCDCLNYFSTVVTIEFVKKPKPSPELFLLAAEKLGVKPRECAVVEDAIAGIAAAKTAGMTAIAFENKISEADYFTESFPEVEEIINEIREK